MMNLKKKIAPVLMGGALAVATAVPVFAADAGTSTGLSSVETALTSSFTSIGSSMTKRCRKDPSDRTSNYGSSSPCWIWYQSI